MKEANTPNTDKIRKRYGNRKKNAKYLVPNPLPFHVPYSIVNVYNGQARVGEWTERNSFIIVTRYQNWPVHLHYELMKYCNHI